MEIGLAFFATAMASWFAQTTAARYTRSHKPHELAWTVALALFALASAALVVGVTTGWDDGTFRAFYLLGAIVNVPWLALGTVFLLAGRTAGRRVQWGLVFFSGLATGVMLSAPIDGTISGTAIPSGREVLGVLPRVLAAVGSGVGAIVIIGGALWSAARLLGAHDPGSARRAGANVLIALGTVILSSGGLLQGVAKEDEAFTISLALGITVIYAGFTVAARVPRAERAPAAGGDAEARDVSPIRPSRASGAPGG